jgi:hypothetical protein
MFSEYKEAIEIMSGTIGHFIKKAINVVMEETKATTVSDSIRTIAKPKSSWSMEIACSTPKFLTKIEKHVEETKEAIRTKKVARNFER